MKQFPTLARATLSITRLLCVGLLFAATSGAVQGARPLALGVLVTEYARHDKQTSERQAHIPLEEFGKPIGDMKVVSSLAPWHHTSNRNAIAHGYLEIAADGDYAFTTDSFYDRNLLMVDGEVICEYADGGDRIVTIPLKKGHVEIVSVGFIGGRGQGQGIEVRWRPPGQRELSPIPEKLLKHGHPHKPWKPKPRASQSRSSQAGNQTLFAKHLVSVSKDFVIDVYHNGQRVADERRHLLLDRFGASAERVDVKVSKGDWLVFHVAHNRLRHRGSKFFAVAGMLDDNEFGFVSDRGSMNWSVCDDPAGAAKFIANRKSGLERRPSALERVWEEGMGFMRKYAGSDFKGGPIWGEAPATWIKFTAGEAMPPAKSEKTHAEILSALEGSWTFTTTGNTFRIGIDGTVYGGEKDVRVVIMNPVRRIIRLSDHLFRLSADGMQLSGKGLKGGSKHSAKKASPPSP
jgi:hypothetical protein